MFDFYVVNTMHVQERDRLSGRVGDFICDASGLRISPVFGSLSELKGENYEK